MNKNRVTLICEQCGKEYDVKQSKQNKSKFCSIECKNSASISKGTLTCKNCGKLYEVHTSELNRSRFCSLKCKTEYNKPGEEKEYICRWCKKTFLSNIKNEFCSVKCENATKKYVNDPEAKKYYPNRGLGETKKKCLVCGKEYIGRMDFCDAACFDDAMSSMKDEYKRVFKETLYYRAIDIENKINI